MGTMDTTKATMDGRCNGRFEAVRQAFADNFSENDDVGASVAVAVDGDVVVDLWGGSLDRGGSAPWDENTLVNVFSTTKTMSCLALLVCADRALVDLDAPVARYWPGFEVSGKDGVLVRHLMAHTAGLSGWAEPMTTEGLYDWERCTSLLAAQAPWWEPGTKSGYHALTQGYLVGEVVRRVTGFSVGRFFADEIAGPLGADFHIGLAAEHDDRVAPLIPVPPLGLTEMETDADADMTSSVAYRTFSNPTMEAPRSFDKAWRRAEIPAAGGQGNARSVLASQHVVACGGEVGGVRLLSPQTCERILDVQAAGRDLVLGIGVTFGIGYGLNSPRAPISPSPRVCYWGGWGGSLVVNDLDTRMTMAYVMNRMGEGTVGDDRAHHLLRAVYASLTNR